MSKKLKQHRAEVEEALDALFSDTSVSQNETKRELLDIIAHIRHLIEGLTDAD